MTTEETSSNPGLRQIAKIDKIETHKEKIIQYLVNAGEGILLTDKQKELLVRWEFADEKIRLEMGKSNRHEIALMLVSKFNVSMATAKSDMVQAEEVFSSSNPINKKHRIQLRVEWLEKQARLAAAAGDFKAVGMIEKSIAFYLDKYPETKSARPRRQVIYNLQQNILNSFNLDSPEADGIINDELSRLSTIEIDDKPLSDPEEEINIDDIDLDQDYATN